MKVRAVRIAAAVTAVMLSTGLLASCGSSDPKPSSASAGAGDIRFSWWGSEQRNARTNAVIDLFQKKFPVKVAGEPVDYLKYFERLNVQAAGGNMPCVTQMLTFGLNDYASKDLFLDLSNAKPLDLGPLDKGVVDSLRTDDGKLYMAPYGMAPSVIAYNKAMAEKYGIDIPKNSMTWGEFFSWMRQAQKKLPKGVFAMDFPYNTPVEVITYLGSRGPVFENGKAAFRAEDLAGWFSTWHALMKEGVVLPAERITDYTGSHEDSAMAAGVAFASARPANALGAIGNGLKSHGLAPDTGYTLLPVADNGTATDLLPINGLSIPKSCDNVASALEFINFWINDASANVAFAADNGAPTVAANRAKLLDSPETGESTKDMIKIAGEVVDRGSLAIDLPPSFQTTFLDAYRRLAISVFTGATSAEAAAEDIISRMG
ncbi:lipoprotein [Acrocarpospora pleiomorpha]|uniref:Lipoprotein n=1 Tax=Acrocarpospora pleiomorpha TaxID=90975 RepID=A0A5M3XGJ5_9ACTN|nr:extracellular solute-binding protein [Acrocarpospora pleiomorpha]GES18731.1 lipoprotein [Acrocarpospora pleiomorpha]